METEFAQLPAVGVKVYVPVVKLLTVEGLQTPIIKLLDVVGKTGGADPLQRMVGMENVGMTFDVTVTLRVNGLAQTPAPGVNK